MADPQSAEHQDPKGTPGDLPVVEITRADLPLRCPLPSMSLWNSHPAVYLPIEDSPDGRYICPYCSTEYVLRDE